MFLFQEKKLQPLTIQGYRTALQDHYGVITPDIRSSSILSRLLQSFHRDRPKALRTLPPWDLRVVLQALTTAPFEPLSIVNLKFLTHKTAFLLALASGARRSELHSVVRSGVKHTDSWRNVWLQPSAQFLAKNQKAQTTCTVF